MNKKLICGIALSTLSLSTFALQPNTQVTAPTTMTAAQAQNDAKILGALIVLNQNEIAAATAATQRASNPNVKNFAKLMISQHGQNLKQTQALSRKLKLTPMNGRVANLLQSRGKAQLGKLDQTNGPRFDKMYMSAMVRDHKEALSIVNKLASRTTNPQLKQQLAQTSAHITIHLQKAQMVASQLKANPMQ